MILSLFRPHHAAVLLAFAGLLQAAPAHAQVTEPDGLVVPVYPLAAEINYGAAGDPDFVTLESLFKFRKENIDWIKDASSDPGAFSPLCDWTGQLVLRAGACVVDFAWYNAVESGGTPPPDSELYTLVPKETLNPMSEFLRIVDYFPLVGDPPQQTFHAKDILSHANYKGGLIGFAIRGNPGTLCSQTHYSQKELNLYCSTCQTPGHWITSLIWQSTATPDAFYLGFEDLPTATESFTAGGRFKNDGDFNDFVYFITGVACEGGGDSCDTGQPGICNFGRTSCGGGACRPVTKPAPERCDNLDNDCNGMVDDNAPCPSGRICSGGTCVNVCGGGEFACAAGFACENGLCVEDACRGVSCDANAGKVCRAGACVGVCDDVVCPIGQECILGKCFDPCAGVTCGEGTVCERGVCVTSCRCKGCKTGYRCEADGRCADAACEGKTCPEGQVCVEGNCVDPCADVVCPGGAQCVNGMCGEPDPDFMPPVPMDDGGGIIIEPNPAGSGGTTAGDGTGAGADSGSGRSKAGEAGCACRAESRSSRGAGLGLVLLGLGFAVVRRRRLGSRSAKRA